MTSADRFFEDVLVGDVALGEPITLTEDAIIAFGRAFDPQPFHTDPVAAASGPFGGLIASGWHLPALIMKQLVEASPFGATPIVGLGVDELRWLHPVRAGDHLTVRREVVSAKRSRSKPDRGVVRTLFEVTNQAGVKVISYYTLTQVRARTPG